MGLAERIARQKAAELEAIGTPSVFAPMPASLTRTASIPAAGSGWVNRAQRGELTPSGSGWSSSDDDGGPDGAIVTSGRW